jgi:hypothetical protein
VNDALRLFDNTAWVFRKQRLEGPGSVVHYWLFGLSNQSYMTGPLQSDSSQDCGWCTQ